MELGNPYGKLVNGYCVDLLKRKITQIKLI